MFYVYLYLDPVNFDTFYVGKGTGQRWKLCTHRPEHNKWLARKINKIGAENILIKMINCKSEEHAFQLEKEIIQQFGRRDLGLGTLLNMTDGGEGLSGAIWTDERKANKSIEVKKHFEKNGNPFKGKKHTEDAKHRMHIAKSGSGNYCAVLDEEKVLTIRANFIKTTLSNSQFCAYEAKKYNINISTIADVITNRNWKHVEYSEKIKKKMKLNGNRKSRKGIQIKSGNWKGKLNEEKIRTIRAEFAKPKLERQYTRSYFAKLYEVDYATICDIINHNTWKYVI